MCSTFFKYCLNNVFLSKSQAVNRETVICRTTTQVSSSCPHIYSLSASFPAGKQNHYSTQGLWVIIGLFAFLLLEKMFPDQDGLEDATSESDLNFNLSVSSLCLTCPYKPPHTSVFIGMLCAEASMLSLHICQGRFADRSIQ